MIKLNFSFTHTATHIHLINAIFLTDRIFLEKANWGPDQTREHSVMQDLARSTNHVIEEGGSGYIENKQQSYNDGVDNHVIY